MLHGQHAVDHTYVFAREASKHRCASFELLGGLEVIRPIATRPNPRQTSLNGHVQYDEQVGPRSKFLVLLDDPCRTKACHHLVRRVGVIVAVQNNYCAACQGWRDQSTHMLTPVFGEGLEFGFWA